MTKIDLEQIKQWLTEIAEEEGLEPPQDIEELDFDE